jgi:flagellar hook-associated protein 1 FlgK
VADLLALLTNAAGSLAAQRALSATASHNIQNASTPGYARQRALIAAAQPAELVNGAFIGGGAVLAGVQQIRDRFVEAQMGTALGNAGASTAESTALQSFHAFDAGAAGSVGEAISSFYGALRALAQNPGDAGLRATALASAGTLAQAFHRASQAVESARSGLDAQLSGVADEVNVEAKAVAELNQQIRLARAAGAEPNDLLDLRQTHLDKLAELTGASTIATSEGDFNVVLPHGQALVTGNVAASLQLVPGASHPTLQVLGAGGARAVATADISGTAGGILAAREGALADAGTALDTMAYDLAGALNAVHAAGTGLDGATGQPLFSGVSSRAGAAGSIAVAITDPRSLATSLDGNSGDARNAQALLDTESAALSGGSDVDTTWSSVVSAFGARAEQAKAFAAQDQSIQANLAAQRESASGVSVDEELVQMQQAQRTYEAISKVIQTADEMLQTLMKLRP